MGLKTFYTYLTPGSDKNNIWAYILSLQDVPKKKFPGRQTISDSWLKTYKKWSDAIWGIFLELFLVGINLKFDNLSPGMPHWSKF